MELKWLEDFLSVAKHRNFSKAAMARHTTQPAFSRRIKAFELWYGVPLIDRSSYPVTLTAAGAAFLPLAEQVVADVYRSRREARAALGTPGNHIKFAMPQALAVYFFPNWWRQQKQHPDFRVTVVAADINDCFELLQNGVCQFLLCYQHADISNDLNAQGVYKMQVGTERLVPVSALDSGGQPLFTLPPRADDTLPLLTYTKESFLGRVTSSLHAEIEAQYRLSQRYESALVEALKAEAVLGEGVAWLPEGMIHSELRAGLLHIIGDSSCTIPLDILLCCHTSQTIPFSE